MPPGTRWDGEKLTIVPEEVEADKEIPSDVMTIMRKMGNSISPMIQLEEDTPSHHDDEKLPILNLSVWIEREEENGTTSEKTDTSSTGNPWPTHCL